MRITAADARRLAVTAQRLAGPRPRPTRGRILDLVRHIGFLQLDPTNVVARNVYLVVWSRLGAFDTTLLDSLLERDRALFETPSFLLPTSDLPLHAATMGKYRSDVSPGQPHSPDTWHSRARDWLARNQTLKREVLARLRRDGPLPLTAFEGRTHVSWTSGDMDAERNVSVMLAILQRRGDVVVAGRRRGHKLYALAQGWFPKVRPLPPRERAREATLRSLRANGLATLKQLRWYHAFNRHVTPDALRALEREGRVIPVEVVGIDDVFYTLSDIERRLRAPFVGRTVLLSPFDPLIKDRERLEMLFGYRYRIE
ncbi:MAG TPA: crosslink repair DNA glycosylase YcaQ family protein, partial [Candidatus Acidoferrales bacterium]|nr:crosslink repair DNA glycosylase YcaQ family protein [Candidatus Acidoferrales bacterium]